MSGSLGDRLWRVSRVWNFKIFESDPRLTCDVAGPHPEYSVSKFAICGLRQATGVLNQYILIMVRDLSLVQCWSSEYIELR